MENRKKSLMDMVLEGAIEKDKVDNCYEYYVHLQSNVEYAKHFAEKGKEDFDRAEKELTQYQDRLIECLKGAGTEIKGNHKVLKLRAATPKVQIDALENIPEQYKTIKTIVKVDPDKKKLKELMGQGEIIDGVSLIDGKRSIIWR